MSVSRERPDSALGIVLLLLVLLVVVPGMLMIGFWGGPRMGGFGAGAMPGAGWVGLVLGVAVVVLILWLLLRAVEAVPRPPPGFDAPLTAREILDARYARGELPRDDYLRMRQDLEPGKP